MNKTDLLSGYLDEEGKFKQMPGKRQKKKLTAMLEFLAAKFESDIQYSEMQINDILNENTSFKDPATLRRLMWGSGLLKRKLDGTAYWKEK